MHWNSSCAKCENDRMSAPLFKAGLSASLGMTNKQDTLDLVWTVRLVTLWWTQCQHQILHTVYVYSNRRNKKSRVNFFFFLSDFNSIIQKWILLLINQSKYWLRAWSCSSLCCLQSHPFHLRSVYLFLFGIPAFTASEWQAFLLFNQLGLCSHPLMFFFCFSMPRVTTC